MVPDSRRFPVLLCEIKVNAVSEMQDAKEKAHEVMGSFRGLQPGLGGIAEQENGGAKQEKPGKEFDAALHEKTCRMQGAAVNSRPKNREQGRRCIEPVTFEKKEETSHEAEKKRWQQGLSDAPGRERPENFRFL